jgi:peroxiredoxin
MSLLDDPAPGFTLESTAGGTISLADTLDRGPTVFLLNRGYWCSYCAEQLGTFGALEYDLWRHHGADVLPIMGDPVPRLVEMRDRFDLGLQLLSDPDLEVARAYTGTETHASHGEIPLSGTFVVDTAGTVRYEQIAEHPADRTYANFVRHLLNDDFASPY